MQPTGLYKIKIQIRCYKIIYYMLNMFFIIIMKLIKFYSTYKNVYFTCYKNFISFVTVIYLYLNEVCLIIRIREIIGI